MGQEKGVGNLFGKRCSSESFETMLVSLGFPVWVVLAGGALVTLLACCLCCTAIVCMIKMLSRGRSPNAPMNRDGSFDSAYTGASL